MFSIFNIILPNNLKHVDRQSACPGHTVPALRLVFVFEDGQNNRISFEKFLGRIIVADDFGDRIKKVKAEIGCRV